MKKRIRQARVGVKVGETDAAATGLGGVPLLVNLAHEMGLFKDVEALLPPKERERGYSPSASVFDLLPIPFTGGECLEDLAVLRADQGLERLFHRKVMAPSTAHDFLRRIQYVSLDGLAQVTCGIRMLMKFAHTLAGYRNQILAHYDHPISTGPLECTNTKIRVLQHQTYGFRDTEFFKLNIYALHETCFELVGGLVN